MTADAARSSSVSMDIRMEREASSLQEDSQRNSLTPRVETESEIRTTETEVPPRVASLTAVDNGTVSDADTLPRQRGRKRKADEIDDAGEDTMDRAEDAGQLELIAGDGIGGQPPVQKSKNRCFACNCRIGLAVMEIGKCKCEYVFCSLHRLPEQHNCTFDHKEHCRQEARAKMVVLRKHVGTALRRLDSDS